MYAIMNCNKSIPDKILDPLDLEVIADALDIDYADEYKVDKQRLHLALRTADDPITLLYNYQVNFSDNDYSIAKLTLYLMGCKVRDSWTDDELICIFGYAYLIYRVVAKSKGQHLITYDKNFTIPDASELLWSITGHNDEDMDGYFSAYWNYAARRPEVVTYVLNEIKRMLNHGIYQPLKVIDILHNRILSHTDLDPSNAMLSALSRNDAYTKLILSLYEGNTTQVATTLGLVSPYGMKMEEYVNQSLMDLEFLADDRKHYFIGQETFVFNQPCGLFIPYVRLEPSISTIVIAMFGPAILNLDFPLSRFHGMSDKAIMDEFGVIIPYSSRQDLFRKYEQYEKGELHFYTYLDPSKFVGLDSPISYTTITKHDQVFGIGQHFYLLDDLVEAIHEEHGIVRICIPPLPSRPSINLAEELVTIMKQNEQDATVELLNLFIEQSQDPLVVEPSLISKVLKPKLKDFLINIMHMGLYARRWKGEGHAIPYKKSSTDLKTRLHEIRIQKLVAKNSEIIGSNGFSDVAEYLYPHNFAKKRVHGLFIPMYTDMCSGNKCIREMAEILIGTGSHYLKELYDETLHINAEPLELHRFEFMNPIAPEERDELPTA